MAIQPVYYRQKIERTGWQTRSFPEIVRTLARGLFEGPGQVAQYFDSLPVEEKHPLGAFRVIGHH